MTAQIPTLTPDLPKLQKVVLDKPLFVIMLSICLISIVMVATASMEYSNRVYGSPFEFMAKHSIYMMLGFVAFILFAKIPVQLWYKTSWIWLLFGFGLLALVLIPGVGKEVNGASRWIGLGPINVQPSEFMKFALVLYVAGYLVRREGEVKSQWSGFLKPVLIVALVVVLLLMEPDFGAVVVILAAILGLMFLGGVRASQFLILMLVSLTSIYFMATSQPYRMERLLSFMEPFAEENVYSGGYQLTQALIAIGRGEWFGVGLGNSMVKLFYLPEAHTDFVFSILAEEFGLFGVTCVLALYVSLIARILYIARAAEITSNKFNAFVCYGIGLLFAIQTAINLGVNTGLLPTKGLTLPLMSYGGTSLIISLAMLGIVQAVANQNSQNEVAHERT